MTKPDENQSDYGATGGENPLLQAKYLKLAREAVDRAKELMENGSVDQLVYAALEVRRAFEALVYENALRFTDELVGEDYGLWQPNRLLERLLEIDPIADVTMAMSVQSESGEWLDLGKGRRVSLAEIRKRYFALGNFLHTPSLAQVMKARRGKPGALAKLCAECVGIIESDLGSTLRFGRFAIFGHIEFTCEGCGGMIRQRLNALRSQRNTAPGTKDAIQAKCSNCPASYEIRADGDDGAMWRPQVWQTECPFDGCDGIHEKWTRELKDGMESDCPSCGQRSIFKQVWTFLPEAHLKAATAEGR